MKYLVEVIMKKDNWMINYKIAKKYHEENGNLLIPSQYTTENIKIGLWISIQRKKYKEKKLSQKQINMLEKIDMVWSVFDMRWREYYELATKYYNKKGNLKISENYISDEGKKLGQWIAKQRSDYKNNKLTDDKKKMLDKIGMIWSPFGLQWYKYYGSLVEYFNKNGNSQVPLRYINEDDKRLGYWLSKQRRDYKKGVLSKEKIELLERVDMVWDLAEKKWNDIYKIAQQYYKENSNLNVPVICNYKKVDLGTWIITQRKNYKQGGLDDNQVDLLNKIGMEWDPIRNYKYIWDENYKIVKDFYNKYNHLYIPTNYISKDGVNIGRWLYEQKLKYKRNKLSDDRKRKLDLLDESWLEPSNTKSSFPEQAVLFYVKKFFPSATKFKTEDISEIDIYIPEKKIGIEYDGPAHIRTIKRDIKKSDACYKKGIRLVRIRDSKCPVIEDRSYKIILKDDSFEALDFGIVELLRYLNVNDADVSISQDYSEISDNYIKSIDIEWFTLYDKLVDYYNVYGDINIPINYKTDDGIKLGRWLSNLRSCKKNPSLKGMRLNTNKIQLLEELDIDWSPLETQWNDNYNLAKEYYTKHGNLLIPNTFTTVNGIKLGRWIGTQRSDYRNNRISKEKIILLEKIGMIWDVNSYNWIRMYDEAKKYYCKKGNLLIPMKYETSEGIKLGVWIGAQRSNYKKNKMSKEKIELLEKIGMLWDVKK